VGRIQSIRKRSFSGQEEATYAQVYFERDGLTMMLLQRDLAKAVRRLISKGKARKVLEHMKKWDGPVDRQWKSRAAANQVAIEQGDPFEYAKVVKSLSKLQASSELRQQDRNHLQQSLDFLTEELAHSLGEPPDKTRHRITEASNGGAPR